MITKALYNYCQSALFFSTRPTRLFASKKEGSFKFSKHKELFAEDYYDQDKD